MSQYIISLPASRDLQEIIGYFAVENVEAGERLGLGGLPLDGYIIFYQIVEDGIEIVRVVSGKRNLKELFADPEEE